MHFKIAKITIATTATQEMAAFYSSVFNSELSPVEAYGYTLYSGSFCGINLLICPNDLAGVNANQNRQQFDIEVSGIEKVLQKVEATGGNIKEALSITATHKIASVTDPDGNTIVFIEQLS